MPEPAQSPVPRALWGLCAVISLAGLAIELWHHRAPSALTDALLPKLSLSFEGNLPTWFASSLLLCCALVAAAIAKQPTCPRPRSWWVVTLAFGWASLDEAAELHEGLGGMFRTGGVLYFDWVISAAVVLLALAVALWPWLRELPRATRWRLILAGCVYFGGAVLLELPLGWWTERYGAETLGYAMIDWVEETLELAGALLMLRALQLHRRDALHDLGAPSAPAAEPSTAAAEARP